MSRLERRARRIFRWKKLPEVTGYSRTKLKEMIDGNEFPKGFDLSEGKNPRKGWDEQHIAIWQDWRLARHAGETELSWQEWFQQQRGADRDEA